MFSSERGLTARFRRCHLHLETRLIEETSSSARLCGFKVQRIELSSSCERTITFAATSDLRRKVNFYPHLVL